MILLLLLPNIKNYLEIFFLPLIFFLNHANITRWKRAPKMFQFIAQVCFFYYFNFFLSINEGSFSSSVIKFECKYLLLLLCTAGQKEKNREIDFTGKNYTPCLHTHHLNCVETIFYTSLSSPFYFIDRTTHPTLFPLSFFHMSKNAY